MHTPIKYALTVSPTIYVSCIKQFWTTAVVETLNGEAHIHAQVDGKEIIITESTVRRDLHLEDAEGVDSLENSIIFEELAKMGYEKKFDFSKWIFKSMLRNLDNVSGKFLMYPRFVQVFLDQQLDEVPNHKRKYISPSHTKKIFANMRRVRKDFSGKVTPLFETMMAQIQPQQAEGSKPPTIPQHSPIIAPSTSQPQKKQQPRNPKRKVTEIPQSSGPINRVAADEDSGNINKTQSKATPNEASSLGTTSGGGPGCQETMGNTMAQTRFERVSKLSSDSLLAGVNTPRIDEDRLKLTELMELCTNLQQKVLDLEKAKTSD
ncbi:hypothetical protein Tco_0756853 [Tanacetum coccineum]